MLKKRILATGLFLIVMAVLFTGCASTKETSTKTSKADKKTTSKAGKYKDGIYFAQEDGFDKNGWKNVVTLKVEDGKIVEADWNGANKTGGPDKKSLSKSGKYGMVAKGQAKSEWHEQAKLAEDYLIEKQDPEAITYTDDEGHTDAISGASISVKDFFTLAKKALDNGPVGRGPYKDGHYRKEAKDFDAKTGWKSYVDMTIINGNIVSCYWSAVNKNGGDDKYKLSAEGKYGMKEKGNAIAEWHEQADKVVEYFLKNQSAEAVTMDDEGKTDAISGATISVKDFFELAKQCLDEAK